MQRWKFLARTKSRIHFYSLHPMSRAHTLFPILQYFSQCHCIEKEKGNSSKFTGVFVLFFFIRNEDICWKYFTNKILSSQCLYRCWLTVLHVRKLPDLFFIFNPAWSYYSVRGSCNDWDPLAITEGLRSSCTMFISSHVYVVLCCTIYKWNKTSRKCLSLVSWGCFVRVFLISRSDNSISTIA